MTDVTSSPNPARHRGGRVLDAVLGNPLTGLAPWILYSFVEGPNRLELSAALALGLALVVLALNWIRGGTPKLLEYSDVAYFAVLAVVVAFAGDGTRRWLELWGGETANIALLVIVVGSILLRNPFTLAYARESTPRQYWTSPEFMRVNYLIAWVWAGAFAIEAASGFYGDAVLENANNIWTGWIIQTLPLIIAAQFTIWYPNRLDAERSGHADASATVPAFLATITPWISIVGVITLFVGGTPEWLAIALIVVGLVLTRALSTKRSPARRPPAR